MQIGSITIAPESADTPFVGSVLVSVAVVALVAAGWTTQESTVDASDPARRVPGPICDSREVADAPVFRLLGRVDNLL